MSQWDIIILLQQYIDYFSVAEDVNDIKRLVIDLRKDIDLRTIHYEEPDY